jgi:Xaa-Pro aminopeptidase
MTRRITIAICGMLVASSLVGDAQSAQYPDPTQRVLSHREQNALFTPWIQKRFDTLLGPIMTREGIDMWIIPSREYNEDPVFASMSPLTYFASRRRTILVFYNPGGGKPVERYSIGRFDYDGLYTMVPTPNDGQHEGLRKLVDEKNPKVIGINESDAWNHADGITANEKRRLVEALGSTHAAKIKSAEMVAVGWLEVKLPEELDAYRHAMKVAHMVIREAFSNKVITPGKTTNEDVVWWMRQRVVEMGLGKWFQPSVTIWRQGEKTNPRGVILPGDMLHTDFGIVYLGYSTDTQHNAYVLKPGETDAPAGLKAGLKAGNRLQDLTMQYARLERTGNQALADALAHAKKEGLVPSIYCHPVGFHGHAAGPPIGMTDYQQGVPVRGDYVFRPNTWHSIELNVTHNVPEWGNQPVRFALEEDAAILPGGKWDWIDGRQETFYLIKP